MSTIIQLRQLMKDLRRVVNALENILADEDILNVGEDPGSLRDQARQEIYDQIIAQLRVATDHEMSGSELNYRCPKYRALSSPEKQTVLKNMVMHGTISTNMIQNGRKPATRVKLLEKSPLPDNQAKPKTKKINLDY